MIWAGRVNSMEFILHCVANIALPTLGETPNPLDSPAKASAPDDRPAPRKDGY